MSFGKEQEFALNRAAVDMGGGVWLWSRRQKGHLREEHGKEAGSAG